MNQDEQFVREKWERADTCHRHFAGGFRVSVGGQHFTEALVPDEWAANKDEAWAAAAEFTRTRLEQIRQVEEEINLLRGMVILLFAERGDQTAPAYKRTIGRLEATLAELRRGMKEASDGN